MSDKTSDRLHMLVMNLPCCIPPMVVDDQAYRLGHRDARHAAAELVSAASSQREALLREMGEALERAEIGLANAKSYGLPPVEQRSVCVALDRARAALKRFKEEVSDGR